eukprot:scaffold13898_cov30-Tisochrysis_lutea.AAC.5
MRVSTATATSHVTPPGHEPRPTWSPVYTQGTINRAPLLKTPHLTRAATYKPQAPGYHGGEKREATSVQMGRSCPSRTDQAAALSVCPSRSSRRLTRVARRFALCPKNRPCDALPDVAARRRAARRALALEGGQTSRGGGGAPPTR